MKKHAHILLLAGLMLGVLNPRVAAQNIELARQVIGVAGGTAGAGFFRLSYTVGETLISTLEGREKALSQGFHQPEVQMNFSVDVRDLLAEWKVKIYPNPTLSTLNLETAIENAAANIHIRVTDIRGAFVFPAQVLPARGNTNLECQSLPPGMYFLQITNRKTGEMLALPFSKIQ